MRLAIAILATLALAASSGCCCCRQNWCGGGYGGYGYAPTYAPTYAPQAYVTPATAVQPVVCPPCTCN